MSQLIPPLCFVLALACLVGVFGMLAFGAPEQPMSLQEARLQGDEKMVEMEESRFRQSVRRHYLLTAALGISAVLLGGAGLTAIRPSH